jgi:hypothetical protein
MEIQGPQWPSTEILRQKLSHVQSPKKFKWAAGGKPATEQLAAFKKAGLRCPEWTQDSQVVKSWMHPGKSVEFRGGQGMASSSETGESQASVPMVFGRLQKHSKGRDIVGPTSKDFWKREFWVKVIPDIVAEWRIHIFDGHSIARGLKVQMPDTANQKSVVVKRGLPVRNRLTGWRMRHDVDPPKEVRETARAAVKALGYLYGAVDLAVTGNGDVYVFEVNTGAGLDDYTAERYAKAIEKWGRA